MSLSLPPNFEKDIQGKDTALVPIIILNFYPVGASSYMVLSTGQFDLRNITGTHSPIKIMPLLLNMPSLKESIDIEKRNYKISSANIDISNFPYEGKRFSDLAGDKSLINVECTIYWASPSSNHHPLELKTN